MFYWEVLWFCGQNPAPNALQMHSAELMHYRLMGSVSKISKESKCKPTIEVAACI